MTNLIESLGLETVVIVIIVFCIACFGIYQAVCWIKDRYVATHNTIPERVEALEQQTSLLLESDKIRIKGEILLLHTECMETGKITEHQLEYLHDMFKVYEKENGNSFVHLLVDDLHKLYIEGKKE